MVLCEETDPEAARETYPYEITHDRTGTSFQTAEEAELFVSSLGPYGLKIHRNANKITLKELRADADKERRARRRGDDK